MKQIVVPYRDIEEIPLGDARRFVVGVLGARSGYV